jgi:ribonucleoside-diphosphate reductase alpha chain
MQRTAQILSDLAFYRTYSQVKPTGLKESWNEVINRYQQFLLDQNSTAQHDLIVRACTYVRNKQIVPSMRMLQFAGEGLSRENLRAYNCSFVAIKDFEDISDIFYILMNGTGVGFSVQQLHVSQLPTITPNESEEFAFAIVGDSREAWAQSVKVLLENPNIEFDYSQIRAAGTRLSTGGTASGPESLRTAHNNIRRILRGAQGRKLRSIEVHDIVCYIADVVVVGGVRRAALISLFDRTDEEMLYSKVGAWWERNPQRARANNSAVLVRGETTQAEFERVLDMCLESKAGEPGIFWTNDRDYGTNPCAEISLQSQGLCNLTEINAAVCENEFDFAKAAYYATVLGTFQASLTNFNYVKPRWKQVAEQEALLGVSITGQAQNWENLQSWDLAEVADMCKLWNAELAKELGINHAARVTTVKPSGTTSTVLGTAAGIHGVYAPHYIRRVRINRDDPMAIYLQNALPKELVEVDQFQPSMLCIAMPIKMKGIVASQESCVEQLERAKFMHSNWIRPGHNHGPNTHNVSLTVYYREGEDNQILKDWMWQNQTSYSGISLLPLDTHTYIQAPYEAISEERYRELEAKVLAIDLDLGEIRYWTDYDSRQEVSGCEGNLCSLPERAK